MTVEYGGPDQKSGTWSYCGLTALSGGGSNTVDSQGTWEETAPLKFRYRGTAEFSDGGTCGLEFDGDVGDDGVLTLSGKIYEWT